MYKIVRLKFKQGVHFGTDTLEHSKITFCADTLFSALFIEALSIDKNKQLMSSNLYISDTFPFKGDELYLPKPLLAIRPAIEADEDTELNERKLYKKLEFIAQSKFHDFLNGRIMSPQSELLNDFGESQLLFKAATRNGIYEPGEEEIPSTLSVGDNRAARPYSVGTYLFKEECGLYFVLSTTEQADVELVEELLESLKFVGIGGKRSAGLGQFEYEVVNAPEGLSKMLDTSESETFMTIATCLPLDSELNVALKDANYLLSKRSGFVYSNCTGTNLRKKDLYKFVAGSVFKGKFKGKIEDVRPKQTDDLIKGDPVYSYSKPLFVGLKFAGDLQ